MFATALLCTVLAQAPSAAAAYAWFAPGPGDVPDAVAVRGEAELSPAEAFDSARERAAERVRERWLERADRLVAEQRPFWLPAVFAERAVDRFLGSFPLTETVRLVDREDKEREHEFGSSWQTTLWIAEDPQLVRRAEQRLRRELQRATHRTLATSGGTVVFWAVLAFAIGWVDRLSRGYMTGRLRAVGVLLGVAVPTLAFLL